MGPDPKDKLKSPKQAERLRQELQEMHARTKRLLEEMEELMETSRRLIEEGQKLLKKGD